MKQDYSEYTSDTISNETDDYLYYLEQSLVHEQEELGYLIDNFDDTREDREHYYV